jgi:hypothetical protein
MTNGNKKSATFLTALGICAASGLAALIFSTAHASPAGYTFTLLATLGTPFHFAIGDGFVINDFEPGSLNNSGDAIYGADIATCNDPACFIGEGVFLQSSGKISNLVCSTCPAPGGGTFDFLLMGQTSLNEAGNGALAFSLVPFGAPEGVNSGLFRYSHVGRTITAAVLPFVTPAPGGGIFQGVFFGTSLNNAGTLVFTGIIPTDQGVHIPGQAYPGLGMGVFKASANGQISSMVRPGDPAPGGGTFDIAESGWINDGGDVAFEAHVAGEEAAIPGFPPQAVLISALGSLYVKNARSGGITSIAHAGDPAPGGGTFRQTLSPVMNNAGNIAFLGDLTPAPSANQVTGVYVYSSGVISKIAAPGDPMPGGGNFVTASTIPSQQIDINNRGDVVFNAVLDTDVNKDGVPDNGLFVWSQGLLRLVAGTGTVIPGVGTVSGLVMNGAAESTLTPNSGAINNARGQVLFGATLTDGRGVLLLATP